jgi:small-conductance mechanosensitive channel
MNKVLDKLIYLWESSLNPLFIILIGIVSGIFFKKYIFGKIKTLTKNTSWKGDDIAINAINSVLVFWFFLGSLSFAIKNSVLSESYALLASNIVSAFLVISISFTLSKIIIGLLDLWSSSNSSVPSTGIFKGLVNFSIFSLAIIYILQSFNVSIAPLITALGVGGLAVSLAMKDTLADLFGGLNLLISQTMKEGDYIELDNGHQGYIQNIGWRFTTLKERSNNIISIPNSVLSGSISKNYTKEDASFRVPIQIGVSYDSDLSHVEKVTLEVAKEIYSKLDCVDKSYDPTIRFREFGDSSINFFIYFQGKAFGDHNEILNEFIKRLHVRYKEENIEIPFPIRTLIHKNEVKN